MSLEADKEDREVMTLGEVISRAIEVFPDATVKLDSEGQFVIYTNEYEGEAR